MQIDSRRTFLDYAWVAGAILVALGLAAGVYGMQQTRPSTDQEKPATAQKQEKAAEKNDDDDEKANADLEKAIEKAKIVTSLTNGANKSFAAGDYRTAFEKISKVCELEPNNISYHLMRGDVSFAAGDMKACVESYDQTIRLQPTIEPRLWQRGLALYYADRFKLGVEQFETHQTINSQDVENAVWHLLCAAQISDVDQARKKLIPISGDTRVPMSQIYEMFAGRMTPEQVLEKAKKTTRRVTDGSEKHKLQLYYAHLYIGLYHEMLNKPKATIASLKLAEEINPLGKINFMGQVARVHLKLRDASEVTEK